MRAFYNFAVALVRPICAVLYPRRRNICAAMPEGAAIVCANHSNYIDPVLIAIAAGKKHWLHFMAKVELSRSKLLDVIIRGLGAFYVNRNSNDLSAIRTAMGLLKHGEKVGIFPEGTRVSEDDAVTAKNGAVRLAMRLGVPVVPVFISRNKKLFRKVDLVIGEAYYIDKDSDNDEATRVLMEKIHALDPRRGNL